MRPRRFPFTFTLAATLAALVWYCPKSWSWSSMAIVCIIGLIGIGVLAAMGRAVRDLFHPRRRDMRVSQRDLDRAFRAGRDLGAVDGPSNATLARWRREGFSEPGPGR